MTLYYKMRQILLQNATAIFLQNATTVYYKMHQVFYYKMRQFYYKMQQLLQIATILLQNATVLLQNATFITNCDSTERHQLSEEQKNNLKKDVHAIRVEFEIKLATIGKCNLKYLSS